MIFARDKSQMCNNLLQYAHVYAWGREHGRKVISMRFSYKYPFFKICHTDLTGFGWYLLAKYASAVGLLPIASFKHAECDAEALERKMLRHRHIVVSGWYARWYDLFLKYRDEICDLFTIDAQYTESVRKRMQEAENNERSSLRLGVHIRRGDYAVWKEGIYCYADEQYVDVICQFAAIKPDQSIDVYLSTNDLSVSAADYQRQVANDRVRVHLLGGNAVEDLFMLSECDYLIGPPSTFSLVAAMYRDIPLCRMDQLQGERLTLSDFRLFDYWFRILV